MKWISRSRSRFYDGMQKLDNTKHKKASIVYINKKSTSKKAFLPDRVFSFDTPTI